MEAGGWLAVLLDEALHGEQDLKRWDRIVEQRKRVYVTDSQSVFDYTCTKIAQAPAVTREWR